MSNAFPNKISANNESSDRIFSLRPIFPLTQVQTKDILRVQTKTKTYVMTPTMIPTWMEFVTGSSVTARIADTTATNTRIPTNTLAT